MMNYVKKAMSKIANRKYFDIETGDPVDEMMEAIKVTYGAGMPSKRMGTKRLPCSAEGCSDRRIHHERPDTPRGTQYCEVKTNHTGPVFCSLNCYFYWQGCMKEKQNGNS